MQKSQQTQKLVSVSEAYLLNNCFYPKLEQYMIEPNAFKIALMKFAIIITIRIGINFN